MSLTGAFRSVQSQKVIGRLTWLQQPMSLRSLSGSRTRSFVPMGKGGKGKGDFGKGKGKGKGRPPEPEGPPDQIEEIGEADQPAREPARELAHLARWPANQPGRRTSDQAWPAPGSPRSRGSQQPRQQGSHVARQPRQPANKSVHRPACTSQPGLPRVRG